VLKPTEVHNTGCNKLIWCDQEFIVLVRSLC